jgi:hypothetical protein
MAVQIKKVSAIEPAMATRTTTVFLATVRECVALIAAGGVWVAAGLDVVPETKMVCVL